MEDPKRYCHAGQKSGKDSDPRNHEGPSVGVVHGGVSLSPSRDAEPTKEQETGSTSGTATDVAAHQKGQVFMGTTRMGAHHASLATGTGALGNITLHNNLILPRRPIGESSPDILPAIGFAAQAH